MTSPIHGGAPMRISPATAGTLLLLAAGFGCSGGQPEAALPDAEISDVPAPSVEPTDFPEPGVETEVVESPISGGQVGAPVAVELPGLPVGGQGVEFQLPGTLCVDVSWSGTQLPTGVRVTILAFLPLDHFTVGSGCAGLPPCLHDDFGFTADGGTCGAEVSWDGMPSAEGSPVALGVAKARLTCDDDEACAQAQSQIRSDGVTAIDILWNPIDGTSSDPSADEGSTGSVG